jgi:hypothetical protein
MYAIITIAVESKDWEVVPMPGCPAGAIAEILDLVRMNVSKGGGSIRVVETVIKEKK